MNISNRWLRLALYATAAIVALASVLIVSAHDKAGPDKKLFGKRWHYEVVGDDYDSWMTLTVSPVWLDNCGGTIAACKTRWGPAFDAGIAEWNAQPTTIEYVVQPSHDPYHDVNVAVFETVLDEPGLLGIDLTFDESEELCLHDACSVWYEVVLLADSEHDGPYGTPKARKTTIVHELGHGLSLRHESVNSDESIHYDCGQDDTGPIPHSVMSYDCIRPVALGGLGESFVQKWDVCGVNHAYHDPTIGYAYCDLASAAQPDGGLLGDADCNGTVTPIDAAVVLQIDGGLLSALPCPTNADANDDGTVTVIDAAVILQYDAGFVPSLPPP